ncbi:MAG: S46 family peptidase [Bacteroidales bacterium]
MKRLSLFLFILFLFVPRISAVEGMWLPMLLEKYNIEEMQQKGFRLTAEDIYSVNQASMKDAVVRIGGCTGVVISGSGLVLTNHHCAYGSIQSHSSVSNDYLTDGFWAMSGEEELPNPGLTVTFLVRMEDVTEKITGLLREDMTEDERQAAIAVASSTVEKEAVEGTRYRANVNAFYYGSEFYLFVYDLFEDVRLVGAPPSSIGKFGGDTDNWMWPRHTGDFAFFRIYADADNNPSAHSENNVPYNTPVSLPVSTRGVSEGDFTMVFGFPGVTNRYLTSHAVRLITEVTNPHSISLRDKRLEIMDSHMALDDVVRIQYASKYAGVSNAWKRWKGENLGLARIDGIGKKKAIEKKFSNWANDVPERNSYAYLMPAFDSLYTELEKYTLPRDYGREGLYAIEIIRFVNEFSRLLDIHASGTGEQDLPGVTDLLRSSAERFFRNYHQPIDRDVFVEILEMYRQNIDPEFHPDFFLTIDNEFNSDISLFAAYVFNASVFSDKDQVMKMIDILDVSEISGISEDPLMLMAKDIRSVYENTVVPAYNEINQQITVLYRDFVEGLRLMEPDRAFFPDANRTLRVTYGNVEGYHPRDAVYYNHYTTISGVMEKHSAGIADYDIPSRLIELYENKDFGEYDVDGNVRVAFIASNHTSGGNSGSPVINGDGHLIGVNFDRVWEGTMSDIMFDPDRCRNISVDINYVLFITDRYAGAGYLLDEMTIIR